MKSLVLTFIATDRPGLVDTLSEAVTDAGGNWLESRMARLAEKFAGIARVEIPADREAAFKAALSALENLGFTLTVEAATTAAPPDGLVLHLELLGPDHPGIVTTSPIAWPNMALRWRRWRPVCFAHPWAATCWFRPPPGYRCPPP